MSTSEPARVLSSALRELYLRAGEPSMRQIASACGPGVISHNTVHKVLGAPHVATLRHLCVVVEQLSGDVAAFRELWIAARLVEEAAARQPDPPSSRAAPARPAPVQPAPDTSASLFPADELFLVCHHSRDGRPMVNRKSLGIALAGAVLVELHDAGLMTFQDGQLTPCDTGDADPFQTVFLDPVRTLSSDGFLEVQQWVRYLKEDAVRMVGQRLADAGLVVPEQAWRFPGLSGTVRYPQTGDLRAAAPMVRLRRHLLAELPEVDGKTAMLAALLDVMGAHRCVPLDLGDARLRARLRLLASRLAEPARAVVMAVDLAIAKSAVTPDI